jgi:hypothetical protein
VRFIAWTTLMQVSPPDLSTQLDRIMWAQLIMAGVMVLLAVATLAVAVAVLLLVRRAMDRIEAAKTELLPHVTPVLSRASTIADDVRHMTAGFRDDADEVHRTVRDLLDRTRSAVDTLDDRVRRFGLVLEVVQQQAEELLMDAAATARGVPTAAQALREEPSGRPRTGRGRRIGPSGHEP